MLAARDAGRDARELVEQDAYVALEILALTKTEHLESRDKGIGGFDGVRGDVGRGRRVIETDRQQAKALVSPDERQEQGGSRFEPCGQIGHLVGGVRNQRRHASLEGVGDHSRLDRAGQPRIGSQ